MNSAEVKCVLAENRPYAVLDCPGGAIDSITPVGLEKAFMPLTLTRFGTWGAVLLRRPPKKQTEVTLLVTGSGARRAAIRERFRLDPVYMPGRGDSADYEDFIIPLEHDSMRAGNPAQQHAARYFHALDVATNPALFHERQRPVLPEDTADPATSTSVTSVQSFRAAEKEFRSLLIQSDESIGTLLWTRLMERGYSKEVRGNRHHTPARIAYLSALQLEILDRAFPARAMPEIALAYEMFACGDLYLSIEPDNDAAFPLFSSGGPNSALAFCFAEFAMLAIEQHIDADRWGALLPVLASVQEIYPLAFNEIKDGKVVRRKWNDYSRRPKRTLHFAVLREIHDRYGRMTRDELYAAAKRNIERAIEHSMPASGSSVPDRTT